MRLKVWQAILLGLGWLLLIGVILQGRHSAGELLRGNEEVAAANQRLERLDEAKTLIVSDLIRRGDRLRDSLGRENTALATAREKASREAHTLALALQARLDGDTVGRRMLASLRAADAAELSAVEGRATNAERLQKQAEDERDAARALNVVRAARIDTLTIDRDYWKGEALSLATDFSLVGWLPKGPLRIAGTALICGAAGVGVGLVADDEIAGMAMAGGCALGAAAF